jgi:UDP-N-acetylmuramoyl-L-alanyl-D-glutamate--2,6-diaminopimelate ligase
MKTLAAIADFLTLPAQPALPVADLTSNSQAMGPGALFLAVQGEKQHGLRFAEAALAQGAAAVFWELSEYNLAEHQTLAAHLSRQFGKPCVPVPQLKAHLSALGDFFYDQPSAAMQVIAVTGTNGKSTITHWSAQLSEALGVPSAVIGTLGYGAITPGSTFWQPLANTTPDALLLQKILAELRDSGFKRVFLEASSHGLQQQRLQAVHLALAAFSNLSPEHLDYHLTMAAYAEAKSRLFFLPGLRKAVLNIESPYSYHWAETWQHLELTVVGSRLYPLHGNVKSYFWPSAVQLAPQLQFLLRDVPFQAPFFGQFQLENLLVCIGILRTLGHELAAIAQETPKLRGLPGRLERLSAAPEIFLDYAHTPDALRQVLSTLRGYAGSRPLYCLFGCGGERDHSKRPVMGRIAEQWADVVIVTDDNPRSESPERIRQAILLGMEQPQRARNCPGRAAAIVETLAQLPADALLLLAGKGHEEYQEIQGKRLPYSDAKVVAEYLATSQGVCK